MAKGQPLNLSNKSRGFLHVTFLPLVCRVGASQAFTRQGHSLAQMCITMIEASVFNTLFFFGALFFLATAGITLISHVVRVIRELLRAVFSSCLILLFLIFFVAFSITAC